MSPTVRDTRTIEWTIAVTNGQRTGQETQHDSRMVIISEGLPLEMKKATHGSSTTVFRPDLLTMRWSTGRTGAVRNGGGNFATST